MLAKNCALPLLLCATLPLVASGVNVGCWPPISDWDTAGLCSESAVYGSDGPGCGAANYPCHVTVTTSAQTGTRCGECRTLALEDGRVFHLKVIGVEVIENADWDIRANRWLVTEIGRSRLSKSATCGDDAIAVAASMETVECPITMSCWDAATPASGWDNSFPSVCGGGMGSNFPCGTSPEDPCPISKTYLETPTTRDACGTCVTITSEGQEPLYGVVVGGEVDPTARFDYRVNQLKFAQLNGVVGEDGIDCGQRAAVQILAVTETPCPSREGKFGCWWAPQHDWDIAGVCGGSVEGSQNGTCGTGPGNPCHVTEVFDINEPSHRASGNCGSCLEIVGADGSTTVHAKIVGAEGRVAPAWQYRVSEDLLLRLGAGPETCPRGGAIRASSVKVVDCVVGATCLSDGTRPIDGSCKESLAREGSLDLTPITLTVPLSVEKDDACGRCFRLTGPSGVPVDGVVAEVEVDVRAPWRYRVDATTLARLRGVGDECLDGYDSLVALSNAVEIDCDEGVSPPQDSSAQMRGLAVGGAVAAAVMLNV